MGTEKDAGRAKRPSTVTKTSEKPLPNATDQQLEVALTVVEIMAQMRHLGVIHDVADCLTPREKATYAAALYRLERFIDQESG